MTEFNVSVSEETQNYTSQKPLIQTTEGNVARNLGRTPTTITPLENFDHIERHFRNSATGVIFGSEFIDNEEFGNAEELARKLETMATEAIPLDKYDRVWCLQVTFPSFVGRNGVVEITPEDEVLSQVRDAGGPGEAVVNTVQRSEKPLTRLVTSFFRPVFPPKGEKGGEVKFQLAAAFPGESAPQLVTKYREQRRQFDEKYRQNDTNYDADKIWWESHAFVILSPQTS